MTKRKRRLHLFSLSVCPFARSLGHSFCVSFRLNSPQWTWPRLSFDFSSKRWAKQLDTGQGILGCFRIDSHITALLLYQLLDSVLRSQLHIHLLGVLFVFFLSFSFQKVTVAVAFFSQVNELKLISYSVSLAVPVAPGRIKCVLGCCCFDCRRLCLWLTFLMLLPSGFLRMSQWH